MKIKWKQREKPLVWKYEDNMFEKNLNITHQIKGICKEWKKMLCQR